jgi:predicted TPR repeat methyltransferase
VFTLERLDEAESDGGYRLEPHGRYSHGEAHLRGALHAARLEIQFLSVSLLRLERGRPVMGYVVAAGAPASTR